MISLDVGKSPSAFLASSPATQKGSKRESIKMSTPKASNVDLRLKKEAFLYSFNRSDYPFGTNYQNSSTQVLQKGPQIFWAYITAHDFPHNTFNHL